MTIVFGNEVTVTTWGEVDGQQRWRARGGANGEKVGHFLAPRDAPDLELYRLGMAAITAS